MTPDFFGTGENFHISLKSRIPIAIGTPQVVRYFEVYALLKNVLSGQIPKPFNFLDIACGDASASAAALKDTSIARYFGIDLSARSLELASENLKVLSCPFELRCCDFAQAIADWLEPVDVVWIGMSLHHLQPLEKAELMKNVHKAFQSFHCRPEFRRVLRCDYQNC